MHSGERPFHCTKCPAAFGYESALYNHNKLVHLKHKVRDMVRNKKKEKLAIVEDGAFLCLFHL